MLRMCTYENPDHAVALTPPPALAYYLHWFVEWSHKLPVIFGPRRQGASGENEQWHVKHSTCIMYQTNSPLADNAWAPSQLCK